eukprot:7882571-Pyramimonas_sp.AAC.1
MSHMFPSLSCRACCCLTRPFEALECTCIIAARSINNSAHLISSLFNSTAYLLQATVSRRPEAARLGCDSTTYPRLMQHAVSLWLQRRRQQPATHG